MDRHSRSTGWMIAGIALTAYAALSTSITLGAVLSSRDPIPPARLIGPGAMLLVGIALLLWQTARLGNSWRSSAPKKAKRIIRKLSQVRDDRTLMQIGRETPQDEVALAAFQRVKSQSELGYFIRNGNGEARQMMALECLTDEAELRDIALTGREPFASSALARMKDEKRIAEVAATSDAALGMAAFERLTDAVALAALANNPNAPLAIRRKAFEMLGQPALGDGAVLASADVREAERKQAAARLLETGDPAQIVRAAELLCQSGSAPTTSGRDFLSKAAKAWPDSMLPLGEKTWSNGCGDVIRAAAWEAQGRAAEAARLRLESPLFTQSEKKRAGKKLLVVGDETTVGQTVDHLLAGKPDPAEKEFVLAAAETYPRIIQSAWPKVREWGHTDINDHTDNTTEPPHYDHTQYFDYFRYPDGRLVANLKGRKSHTDGPVPSSDCTEYGHTDANRHTDTLDTDYLARFPQAVKGE